MTVTAGAATADCAPANPSGSHRSVHTPVDASQTLDNRGHAGNSKAEQNARSIIRRVMTQLIPAEKFG
jgi:hypothetical protein